MALTAATPVLEAGAADLLALHEKVRALQILAPSIDNPGRPLTAELSPKDVGFGLLLSPADQAGTVH
jgi:hypothetical protein